MSGVPPEGPSYVKPRVAAGLALVGLVIFLYVADVLSSTYAVDLLQLGLLLGMAGLFLGVEAAKKLLR